MASKRQRAQILLAADAGHPDGELKDEEIARALNVSVATVERIPSKCSSRHGASAAMLSNGASPRTSPPQMLASNSSTSPHNFADMSHWCNAHEHGLCLDLTGSLFVQ